jgi:hypothetical protein
MRAGEPDRIEGEAAMTLGMVISVLLAGLVGLEICQWHIGIPLIIVWALLMGLLGFIWAMVLNIYVEDHYPDDYQ